MALSILDGTQTATTLSTILSSGQHITAHTVVSLGTQAITDIVNATSAGLTNTQLRASAVTIGGTVTVGNSLTISSLPAISGTVTANLTSGAFTNTQGGIASDDGGTEPPFGVQLGYYDGDYKTVKPSQPLPISGAVTADAGSGFPGVIYSGILQYIDAEGAIPVSISSVTVGNSVTIGSLPAISGTVTANTFALQGTAVTTSNFTSTTASTVLANFNATREVLTIFNEGAGNLHICAGATCTTIAYQVRLSAGDYYEVPNHQTTITHSAVFATAGTARVTELS